MDIHDELNIRNTKRGDILYYSISQVANLLGEEDSSIRYYTNVFDNILKIEISNKEFTYTNNDIDKLEFLINLKNKGMTIKEIQKYCEALPLNLEELVEIKENNSLSVKEIITTIVGLENKEINNLKENLSNKIREDNELLMKKIDNLVSEQNNQLEFFKEGMLKEIKQYIDYKFDKTYEANNTLYNELFQKMDALVSEKLSLENNIKLQLDRFNEISNSRDINLIDEIRKFKNVIERAYYVQQEMDNTKEKVGFIGRLLGIR
jgi:DNA-binding transcriptional MerR regulator